MAKREPLAGNVSYSNGAFGNPLKLVRDARLVIPKDLEFDTMIGRGLSGALVIPILARAFDVHFAIIRKGESCHSYAAFEGYIGEKWLFIDDFIATGETLQACKRTVSQHVPMSTFVGSYCYISDTYAKPRFYDATDKQTRTYAQALQESQQR